MKIDADVDQEKQNEILVGEQDLKRLYNRNIILLVLLLTLFLRKLLDRKNRDCVGNQSNHCIQNGHRAPSGCAAAEVLNELHGDGSHGKVCCKREHEADGANLNTLIGILGDQRGQRCIGDIVCRIENRIQKRVADEEECVLRLLSPIQRNCEAADQEE